MTFLTVAQALLGIGLMIYCGRGIVASRKRLAGMAKRIGTKNPVPARIFCALAFAVGAGITSLAFDDLFPTPEKKLARAERQIRERLEKHVGDKVHTFSLSGDPDGTMTGEARHGANAWTIEARYKRDGMAWENTPVSAARSLWEVSNKSLLSGDG